MDTRQLDIRDSYCSAVWSSNMVHHIPRSDVGLVFKEIYRISKTGALVYIITSEVSEEGVEKRGLVMNDYEMKPRFFSGLDVQEIKDHSRGVGLDVLSTRVSKEDGLIHLIARKPRMGDI